MPIVFTKGCLLGEYFTIKVQNRENYCPVIYAEHPVSDVTVLLKRIDAGDRSATAELFSLVYDELRQLAAIRMQHEQREQILQPTALVHEAFLRLAGGNQSAEWQNRAHFFGAAAEAMRRITVESARKRHRIRHGGQVTQIDVSLNDQVDPRLTDPDLILSVHEALERLSVRSPRKAELVKLRYFAGFTLREASEVLGISMAAAEEDWTFVKAWLWREWKRDQNS